MKRILAVLLLGAMLVLSLSSCSVDMDDKGAIIPLYLSTPQTNLDPTRMIYDKNFVKVAGLIFEGLTVMEDGSVTSTLAKDWTEKYDEDRDEYFLEINLNTSRWNDGRAFTAYQIIYAWKQVLSPETASPAAALLFDIKNAKDVKAGFKTIDELGVAAVNTYTIEVQLERPIDSELFLEAISSPSLVPLRDDVIVNKETTWATNPDDIATDGKFVIKSMKADGEYRLEFSKYYRLTSNPKEGYNAYVKPYKLITDYSLTPDEALAKFDAGEIYYVGEFTKASYAARESEIVTGETLNQYTYFFNTKNPALSSASVRSALSTALDREEIAKIIGLGSRAAKGFVADSATGSSLSKSFRDQAGEVYSAKGDAAAAKSKLGGNTGSIALTFRSDREYDQAVAEYVKGVWESLGFTVSLRGLDPAAYETALYTGDFDVIALDYQGLSTNPYSFLAPFATRYSGSAVSVADDSEGFTPHITGYESDEYDAKVDEIMSLTSRSDRHEKLVELEKFFVEEAPACALVSYVNSYLASSEMSGLEMSPYGYTRFDGATLKDYAAKNAAYTAAQEAAAAAAEAAS